MTEPPIWEGRCALENVKDEPRCREQCANCRALDEETRRLVDLEIAKLGRPGPGW